MKQQVVHIHGGSPFNCYEDYLQALKTWEIKLDDSSRKKRWSRSYDKFLDEKQYEFIRPIMPCKDNAQYREWVIWFEKLIPFLKNEVILVGHSLGGVFLAKYLSLHRIPVSIKQLHLVAAPFDVESEHITEELGEFKIEVFPYNLYKNTIANIYLYASENDRVVNISEHHKYIEHLPEAQVHTFTDRGHFLGEEFPELFENIEK